MDDRIIALLRGNRENENEGYRLLYQHYYKQFLMQVNAAEPALRVAFHEAVVELYLFLKRSSEPVTNLRYLLLNRARWCYLRRYRIDQRMVEFASKHELVEDNVDVDESLVQSILRDAAEACRVIFDLIFHQDAAAWRVAEYFNLKNEKVAKDKIDRCIQEARNRIRTKD